MFVLWVLYYVHFFLGDGNFKKKKLFPFLYSFTVAFVSYCCFIFSWHPLLDLYGGSMGFLWGAQHNFMKFLECFCDTSMGLQKVAYGISMGFLWDFEGFPLDS